MINELNFWEFLSEYFDEEFDWDIHSQIDRFLLDDPDIRAFFNNFNKTIELYEQMKLQEFNVPEVIHIRLFQTLRVESKKKKRK